MHFFKNCKGIVFILKVTTMTVKMLRKRGNKGKMTQTSDFSSRGTKYGHAFSQSHPCVEGQLDWCSTAVTNQLPGSWSIHTVHPPLHLLYNYSCCFPSFSTGLHTAAEEFLELALLHQCPIQIDWWQWHSSHYIKKWMKSTLKRNKKKRQTKVWKKYESPK